MQRIEYTDYARGISVAAWAERYAYDPATDCLHFLSLAGHPGAVKAILAALVSNNGRSVEITTEEEKLILSAARWKRLSSTTTRLAGGGFHGIMVAGGGENDRETLILDATPDTIFRVVYETYPITALSEWTDWLTRELQEHKALSFLSGFNMQAALLNTSEEKLDAIISEGVSSGRIVF